MKSRRCLSLLAAVYGALLLSPALAHCAPTTTTQAATAERKSSTLQITNKNGLVTVEDENNAFLFAQVITTPNLKVSFLKPAGSRRFKITLSDEKNKKIWEKQMGDGGPGEFGFSFKWKKDEKNALESNKTLLTITPASADYLDNNSKKKQKSEGTIVIAPDGLPSSGNIDTGEKKIVLARVNNKIVIKQLASGDEKETDLLVADIDKNSMAFGDEGKVARIQGVEKGATLTLGDKRFKFGTITRNGKQYLDIDLGERHLLIESSSNYTVTASGDDIILSPEPK